MENKNKVILTIEIIVVCVVAIIASRFAFSDKDKGKTTDQPIKEVSKVGNFNVDIIKTISVNSNNTNNLLSPYNIEIALNMLREGADGNTKDEIDKVIGNRVINDVSIKDKLSIANAIFIKDKYKDQVKNDFQNTLVNKYQSEVLYDKFTTPEVINNWVKEKTNDMIPEILDTIDDKFVLGLASALALDVKWQNEFECYSTVSREFTKVDNSKINVQMMHQTYEYNAKYFETDDATGIVLPYITDSNDVNLEFIGILPNSNVNEYINNLTNDKINNLLSNVRIASSSLHINLSLPRFTYEYEVGDFKNVLKTMGINDVFDADNANLRKMIEIPNDNAYVSTAIHKTKIELNEKGTKAAAVTYFGVDAEGAANMEKYETININFDKPFAYMIRESNTGEILFFGTVYEPNLWEGSTCTNG